MIKGSGLKFWEEGSKEAKVHVGQILKVRRPRPAVWTKEGAFSRGTLSRGVLIFVEGVWT